MDDPARRTLELILWSVELSREEGGFGEEGQADSGVLAAARGGVSALVNVGAISAEEALDWYGRVNAAARGRVDRAARRRERDAWSTRKSSPPFFGRELRRIIPTSATAGTLALTLVELYSDGVVVRWRCDDPAPGWSPEVEVYDDRGTCFRLLGMVASGGPGSPIGAMRGEAVFAPEVPADARRLEIRAEGQEVLVPLHS